MDETRKLLLCWATMVALAAYVCWWAWSHDPKFRVSLPVAGACFVALSTIHFCTLVTWMSPSQHAAFQYGLRDHARDVAALGIVLAIALAFPGQYWRFVLLVAVYLPAGAISVLWASYSRRPKAAFVVALSGGFAGWLLSPTVFTSYDLPPTWWDTYLAAFDHQGIPSAIGAATFGGLDFAVSRTGCDRRRVSQPAT